MNDSFFMKRAIELAQLGAGLVAPNPMVGSVIVYKDKIIGEGFHQRFGQAHAEVNAVNSVAKKDKDKLSKSTIYVTLEPCFHFGKTPPCVDLIIEHKIPRVVIAVKDPNPKVSGKSIEKLRTHGVEVVTGVMENEGREVARRFLTFFEHKRPYIILKFAQSADGFIGKKDQQVWLTSKLSKRLAHRWRSEEASILVGTNTAAIDNPRLNNRLWSGRSPIRLVLDRQLRLPIQSNLYDDSEKTIIFTEKPPLELNYSQTSFKNIDFSNQLIPNILKHLYEEKINSVMVEGGTQLLQSFINENLWDEARVFTAPKYLFSGVKAPIFSPNSTKITQTIQVGEDRLTLLRPNL